MAHRRGRRVLGMMILGVTGVALLAALPARAEDLAKEMATAATHAGLAAGSKEMKAVRMHLHHTINCLVGPGGAGFDANEANPCKGQGGGVIPDTRDGAKLAMLRQALAKANSGLAAADMTAAQQDARAAQTLIKHAM
jgi:hypothetical protein